MLDRQRLAKIMAMTTSDNDAEALAAVRRANEVIKGEGLQWGDVLTAAVRTLNIHIAREPMQEAGATDFGPVKEEWVPPHLKDEHVINTMFKAIYAQPRTDNEEFWTFMDSVHHQWQRHNSLTQRQYQAVRNCYNRAIKNARA